MHSMRHSTELILHCNSHFTLNGRCYLSTVEQLEKCDPEGTHTAKRRRQQQNQTISNDNNFVSVSSVCCTFVCCVCVFLLLFVSLIFCLFYCSLSVSLVLPSSPAFCRATHCCLLACVAVVFNALYRHECLTCTSH